jgi:hypothetical protein
LIFCADFDRLEVVKYYLNKYNKEEEMETRLITTQCLTELILGMFKYLAEKKQVEKFVFDPAKIQNSFYKLKDNNSELLSALLFDITGHIAWSEQLTEIFGDLRLSGILEWDDKYYYIRAKKIEEEILDKLDDVISKNEIEQLAESWYAFLKNEK